MFKYTDKKKPKQTYERSYKAAVQSVLLKLRSLRPKDADEVEVIFLTDNGAWVKVDDSIGHISYTLPYPHVTVERVGKFPFPDIEDMVSKMGTTVQAIADIVEQASDAIESGVASDAMISSLTDSIASE